MLWQAKHCVAMIDIPYWRNMHRVAATFEIAFRHSAMSQVARTLRSTPIRYRSDTKVSDRCLLDSIWGSLLSLLITLQRIHCALWISSLQDAIRHGDTLAIDTLRHFADDISRCIFVNGDFWISNNISLKYISYGLIDNILVLVHIMAWRRPVIA